MTEQQNAPSAASNETKSAWASKTIWISALAAIAPLVYPPASAWIELHPEAFSAVMGLVFGALRFATKEKVSIK